MSWQLYQIYYDERQKKEILPFSLAHYNEGLTIFFETAIVKELVPACEAEKVAICSWKLSQKMRNVGRLTPEMLDRDFQVLSFTRNGRDHKMLAMLNTWHPKSLEALRKLWTKLGYREPRETKQPVYQWHFMAKTEIYKRLIEEFVKPAHELIEKDEELHELMISPTNYGALSRDADMKSVQKKLGMSSYPLCPFVLERCPSIWFDLHGYKVSYL